MFGKFLKILGVGVLSGAACRAGSMLIDSLFPDGFGGFVSRFDEPEYEEEDRPRRRKKRKTMHLPR